MNVTSVIQTPQNVPERHVEFAEHVQVRVFETTDTAPIRKSITAQRIERQLRAAGMVSVNQVQAPVQPPQIRQDISAPVQAYKNILHKTSLVLGALSIPSFAFLFLGPIGLVVPAALITAAVVCVLLAGKPTEEMEQARAIRRAEMQEYDPR
jgi:hypothetical protein